mgnify:FL=1
MIKLALTKGRIEKKALDLLEQCGYDISPVREKGRKLVFSCGSLEIILAKAPDVITYVQSGVCDAGIVGRDTIMEQGGSFYELLDLGFGKCRFALAGIAGTDFYGGYSHKTVATKYPNIARRFLDSKNAECEIVKIEGSVELAPILGLADAIIDIVETGDTLRENGLCVFEDVADISSRLIVNSAAMKLKNGEVSAFTKRLSLALTPGK